MYEDKHFEQQLEDIFDQVRPLYEQLHGYVRQRLLRQYGAEIVCADGPIPMHLLRNMWGQSWEHVSVLVNITCVFGSDDESSAFRLSQTLRRFRRRSSWTLPMR